MGCSRDHRWAVAILLVTVFAGGGPALSQRHASSLAFEAAMRDYEAQRFGRAFDTLAALAGGP
jgi:hypothetical protein